jgi:uncharacterized RDD family membrane protein YckC
LPAEALFESPRPFRLLASILYDGVLLIAILFVATFFFLMLFGVATEPPKRYFLQFYLWLVAAVYFLYCWLHGGQTLAMQTWRIRLTDHRGESISWSQAVRRYVLASLGLLFFGAGFLWAVFDRQGLFLHDRLSGSRLVLVEKREK